MLNREARLPFQGMLWKLIPVTISEVRRKVVLFTLYRAMKKLVVFTLYNKKVPLLLS